MIASINNIHRIKNFLSEEEIAVFTDHVDNSSFFKDNNMISVMQPINYASPLNDIVKRYRKKLMSNIEFSFGEDVLEVTSTCIRKWYPRRISRSSCRL
jgi:hypothetical protein